MFSLLQSVDPARRLDQKAETLQTTLSAKKPSGHVGGRSTHRRPRIAVQSEKTIDRGRFAAKSDNRLESQLSEKTIKGASLHDKNYRLTPRGRRAAISLFNYNRQDIPICGRPHR